MNINTKILNIKYAIIMATYWGIVCVICGGFSSVFLLSRNFSNTQVGITVAIGNILGVVIQPYFAAIADSAKKISLHVMTVLLTLVVMTGFIALYFVTNGFLAMAIIFVISFSFLQMLQSFSNSISLYYINRGYNLNFGVARGVGSAFYAMLSTVLGILIEKFNENILLIVGVILTIIFIMCVLSMPRIHEENINLSDSNSPDLDEKQTFWHFVRKYKGFPVVLAGSMFVFIFHNASNTYMFQMIERVGGTAENMGTALSIAAIVELPVMGLFSILAKKIKSRQFLIFAGFVFLLKGISFIFATNVIGIYLCQVLQIGCYGLFIPASVFYVNEIMDDNDTVKGQALMISAQTLGGVFASVLGGAIIDNLGILYMLIFQAVAAGIGALLLLFAPTFTNRRIL